MADPISIPPSGVPNLPNQFGSGWSLPGLAGGSVGTPPVLPGYSGAVPDYSKDILNPGAPDGATQQPGAPSGATIQVGRFQTQLTGQVQTGAEVPGGVGGMTGALATALSGSKVNNVISWLESFNDWSTNGAALTQFKQMAYQSGLVTSANASQYELLRAWQLVVEEGAVEKKSPLQLLNQASTGGGWNAINPTLQPVDVQLQATGNTYNSVAQASTQTSYISYMDPATAQGTLADAYYRLLGRLPTTQEYTAFMNSLYSYETDANSGKFESKTTDKSGGGGGAPVSLDSSGNVTGGTTGAPAAGSAADPTQTSVQENIVNQRGISTRGAEFLAAQTAMQNPDYGRYQAATTYFNAFMKALGGPGAGLTGSGPTVQAP